MADLRLRPEDLANLWVEDRCTPFHVALLGELDPRGRVDDRGAADPALLRRELAARARRVPALGRRMVGRGLGLARPVWVDDRAFRPEDHVRCVALPPGRTFLDWAADAVLVPLPRDRPLWRAQIVVGLPGGRLGLVVVVHHVVADGLTGVAMIGRLLDERPDTNAADRPGTAAPTVALRTSDSGRRPRSSAPAGIRATLAEFGGRTPRTSLPRSVGPGRRLALVDESLDDLRRVGHALGATVNDLLVAGATAGLRALLETRGELTPGLVLRASVPVGRTGAGQTAGMLAVGLPVGVSDPLARLAAITGDTTSGKRRLRGGDGHVMDVLRLPVPLARLLVRAMRGIAGRKVTLFVTDVPGPRAPLWLAGTPLVTAAPVAPLVQGVPLGVAALSYAGRLAITVNADAAVADLDRFADGMRAEFAALARAAVSAAARPAR